MSNPSVVLSGIGKISTEPEEHRLLGSTRTSDMSEVIPYILHHESIDISFLTFLSDTIVDKFNHLSKAVNDRNEKLQITLTRSLSVQDGLDEMLDWMNGVEKSLEEQGQVPLNSAALQDVISKSKVSAILMEQTFSCSTMFMLNHDF